MLLQRKQAFNRSFKVPRYLSAIITEGVNLAVSTVLIVLRETAIRSANSCCERPASLRYFAI